METKTDLKRVIYTALFGGREKLREPKYIPAGWDFVCFTDADLISKHWIIKKIPLPDSDPRKAARKVKILAHEFLPEYAQSIWIDANLIVRGDVNELVDGMKKSNLAVYNHAQTAMDPLSSVADGAQHLIARTQQGKFEGDPQAIRDQLRAYTDEGFPDDGGLAITMVLVRNHHEADVKKTMLTWWDEIQHRTVRDQMSFNYAAWKTGLRFRYLDGDSRDNRYVAWVPHEDISWFTRKWHKLQKLFR